MSTARADCDLEFTGVLLANASARQVQLDDEGHMAPALCIDIQIDGGVHARLSVRQFFPMGAMAQCAAAAHRLKRGMTVTAQIPATTITLAGVAAHIHTHHTEEATT